MKIEERKGTMNSSSFILDSSSFQLRRLGTIMSPSPGDAREAMGVLNPATARGRDGELYLFARMVAAGNYSRVGVARVLFTGDEPTGVERLGFALEPTEPYEQNWHTAGCEDPRVVFIAALDRYVMTYTAYSSHGPRVAVAVSEDLASWRRLGPAKFAFEERWRVDFDMFDNKDAFFFPEPVQDPQGRPALALMHRPDYRVASVNNQPWLNVPDGLRELRPGCWLSYVPLDAARADLRALARPAQHEPLAFSERPWEALKIGGGTPPLLTPHGWLTIYHGVSGEILEGVDHQTKVFYSAGAMLLDRDDPRIVRFRSPEPILAPGTADEREGLVNNVVFPTGADLRGPRLDVYYGMADSRIGVATTHIK
jgi:predicted GH43/DUF377 family glycosyl hydrolase